MYTFDNMEMKYGPLLLTLERLTVAFFAIDFLLRVFTAKYLYPDVSEPRAIGKYLTSFSGIVDMLSFIPYYMPFFFPSGAVAFRMLRIIRIFRLFRINAYYDSLNVITEVIVGKKQQLLSSVFIILILMLSSSLCMYSLENNQKIRNLDISRHSIIVLVRRHQKLIIPSGNLILLEGDTVILYTQTHMANADDLEI